MSSDKLSNVNKPPEGEPNSFVFAIIMCVVCGFLLTAASVGLKERQQKNSLVDQQKNILKAFGLLPEHKLGNDAIQALFNDQVRQGYMTADGVVVAEDQPGTHPLYIMGTVDVIQKYAIPFKAYGLWSWVYGYIALEGDGQTIAGLTVYAHGETPGMGGECEKPWFQQQFIGKEIVDKDGHFVSIGIVKGKVVDSVASQDQYRYVDGISGATITSKGLEKYFKIELLKYEPLSSRLRNQLGSRGTRKKGLK